MHEQLQSSRRSLALRRQVAGAKSIQDATDFTTIVDLAERKRDALSVGDILDTGKVPLLLDEENESTLGMIVATQQQHRRNVPGFQRLSSESGSNILKTLHNLPRMKGPGTAADKLREQKEKHERMEKKEALMSDKNEKLVVAMTTMKNAKSILDPSRLLFDAGILFDEIGMLEKAMSCFTKATKLVNAAIIVDGYDLPESPEYLRKVSRMSERHKVILFAQRAELRGALITAEEERQRLRAMVSYCQLIRIHLLMEDHETAHASLVAAFRTTVSAAEHSELLVYTHNILKEFSSKCFGELSKAQQVVRASAGPLAEVILFFYLFKF